MKWILVLLAIAAVAAAHKSRSEETSARSHQETSYRPNKEYRYQYDSHVLTGIPTASKVHSGVKIRAVVRLQVKTAYRVLMQLDEVAVCKVNDEISSPFPVDDVPSRICRPLSGQESRAIQEQLQKPIQFRYERGQVEQLEADRNEPMWSLNIKRAVLNLLQINLEQRNKIQERPDRLSHHNQLRESGDAQTYRVMEDGIDGDCESLYNIESSRDSRDWRSATPYGRYGRRGQSGLTVTKVRNAKNCRNRQVYKQGILTSASSCKDCDQEQMDKTLSNTAHSTIRLNGDRNNFVITKVNLTGEHRFTPFSEEGGSIGTFLRNILELTDVRDIQQPLSLPRNSVQKRESLKMELPQKPSQRDSNQDQYYSSSSEEQSRYRQQGSSEEQSRYRQQGSSEEQSRYHQLKLKP